MAQCENCGRKFFYEALQKHKKNCALINGEKASTKTNFYKPAEEKQEIKKPRVLMCCICGR